MNGLMRLFSIIALMTDLADFPTILQSYVRCLPFAPDGSKAVVGVDCKLSRGINGRASMRTLDA